MKGRKIVIGAFAIVSTVLGILVGSKTCDAFEKVLKSDQDASDIWESAHIIYDKKE